ncbi:MAG: glycerophosphodiester phosphodiesterase family protein [Thermoleophilia bacterium]
MRSVYAVAAFALAALLALVLAGLLALAAVAPARPAAIDEQVLNVGHRGASGLAPEHKFAAYDLALKQGADHIEQDLQQAGDGTPVVIHDATLDRTAREPAEDCNFPARLDDVLAGAAVGGKQPARRAADAHAHCVAGG